MEFFALGITGSMILMIAIFVNELAEMTYGVVDS